MTDSGLFCAAAVGATVFAVFAHLVCELARTLPPDDDGTGGIELKLENLPQIQEKAAREHANRRFGDRILFGICWSFAGFLWIATIISAYRPQ